MANTYIPITTTTVGSTSVSSIELTSIPATYTDLVLKVSARTDRADTQDDLAIQINSDSTAGRHSWLIIWGNGTAVQSAGNSSDSYGHGGWVPAANATASTFSNIEIYLPSYTTSMQKSFSVNQTAENNGTTALSSIASNLYNQTGAITSIKLFSRSSTSYKFVQYSSVTLYGIKNT